MRSFPPGARNGPDSLWPHCRARSARPALASRASIGWATFPKKGCSGLAACVLGRAARPPAGDLAMGAASPLGGSLPLLRTRSCRCWRGCVAATPGSIGRQRQAFLVQVARRPIRRQLRDYVDDITVMIEAATPGEAAAAALRADLECVKAALWADNARFKDAKEHVYAPSFADRRALVACGGTAVDTARDLGVFHRSRRAHPTLTATLDAQQSVAHGLGMLGGARGRRGAMAVAV